MRLLRLLLALALPCGAFTLALTSAPSPALAAEDAVTRKKVQTYLDLAAELFKSSDFEGALGELRRAEALSELAVVRYNIARCLEELSRDTEAVAAFEKYLSLNDPNDGAAERQKRAKDAIARLRARSFGAIEVNCPIEGSSVLVVGLMQIPEVCPWKGDRVKPGTYDVQTFSPGFPPYAARVQVKPGETVAVLGQGGDGKPPPQPTVSQTPQPIIQQPQPIAQPQPQPEPQPTTTTQPTPPSSDRPLAQAQAQSQSVVVATSQPEPVPVKMVEKQVTTRSTGKIIGGTLLGVLGVGSLVGMSYFMADGQSRNQRIKNGGFTTSDEIQAEADAGTTDNVLAVLFGVVGVGTLVPSVVLFATSGTTTTQRVPATVTLAPVATPHGGGLVLSGTLP
ncbi:MAG: tetratricopeptide repeat protein [Myxococcales bacterium]